MRRHGQHVASASHPHNPARPLPHRPRRRAAALAATRRASEPARAQHARAARRTLRARCAHTKCPDATKGRWRAQPHGAAAAAARPRGERAQRQSAQRGTRAGGAGCPTRGERVARRAAQRAQTASQVAGQSAGAGARKGQGAARGAHTRRGREAQRRRARVSAASPHTASRPRRLADVSYGLQRRLDKPLSLKAFSTSRNSFCAYLVLKRTISSSCAAGSAGPTNFSMSFHTLTQHSRIIAGGPRRNDFGGKARFREERGPV